MLKDSISRKTWLAWIVLGAGLLATIFGSLQVKQGIEQNAVSQFAFACDQVTLKIQERLGAYALILRGGNALFSASKSVDRQEWRAYVEALQAKRSVPGVQGIGFAKVIPAGELASHIARIRAEGFPEYTVSPPGERAVFTSIIYLEPFRDRNLRAFGYDMYSEPVRRAAMEQARDIGVAVLSGKVELVQETGTDVQAGTLMYIPVYRNGVPVNTIEQRRAALIGWVYSPYRMNDLMDGILRDWEGREGKNVHLRIYDGLEATPASLLFDSKPANNPGLHLLFNQQRTIDFNGHQWLLVFDNIEKLSAINYAPAWTTLAGGLALNGLLFGLILAVINMRVYTVEIQRHGAILKESEERFRTLAEAMPQIVWITTPDGWNIYYNQRWVDFTGLTLEESYGYGWSIPIHPDDKQKVKDAWQHAMQTDSVYSIECRLRRADGIYRWWLIRAVSLHDANGKVANWFGTCTDIQDLKESEEKLRLAASVFTHAREGIMITAADGTIIDVNDAFSDITGYSRDEVLGRNPHLLSSGIQEKEFYDAMWRDLIEQGHWHGEVWNQHKNGDLYAVMQTISAVRDEQGSAREYVALFTDITLLKEHEQQLERSARFDALTSLPNRVLLADRLQQAMVQTRRREQGLAVAFLDLDGFKAINDTHGHEAGDHLLITVADRMKQTLREGDTLARMGGDEFVAVLADISDIEASAPMLTRLLTAAAEPVQFGEITLQVSASLGVTCYSQAEDIDADQLLRQADQAMYQAKMAGKNRYHLFDADQDSRVRSHYESLERIRQALNAREFVLYYQPKVNMRTGAVIGAEALIRWQHPEKGLLPPNQFLPAIEDHQLGIELGEWVIDTALLQMETWQAAGLNIPVSVNVGAHQLQHPDFVERLRSLLAAHPNVSPDDLELEVLETSALEDLAKVSQVIDACRRLGVSFSLDDFGTGYSSLIYLKHLPVSQLKIDQSFVRDMIDDPDDMSIVEGVIGLASAFHLLVIAEGAETVEHSSILLQLGCDLAQGYGIARPMPAHQLPDWLATWRPDPVWTGLPAFSHDDMPVLLASVEHRAWIVAIEKYLKGERELLPQMDSHQCRFSMWLNTEGLARHGTKPGFQAIEMLHCQTHALAAELCELEDQGRKQEALARLGELHALRDDLFEQLKILVQEKRQ